MLSRIANNLYWAGRNLERIEHVARFVPVNYFASLDAPVSGNYEKMLVTLNTMAGNLPATIVHPEQEVLKNIAFDTNNVSSIVSCADLSRENCRGARDLISRDLWESVNNLYYYTQKFNQAEYLSSRMSEFMAEVIDRVAMCKFKIDSSMIKDQTWSTLKLGLLMERSFQICRIIQIKINDSIGLDDEVAKDFEAATLLKSLNSFDMSRRNAQKAINMEVALEVLFLNERFPRSLAYCISKICAYLKDLSLDKKGVGTSVRMKAETLKSRLIYGHIDDFNSDPTEYIRQIQECIAEMHFILIRQYFNYD